MAPLTPAAGGDGPANGAMMELLARGVLVQAVVVAARLGIPDLVAGGPRPAGEVARRTGADPDAVARLLRTLAGLGVLRRDERGYGPTPLSRAVEAGPGTVRDFAVMAGELLWEPWGRLEHSVRTGGSALADVHGAPLFEWLERDPGARAAFHAWMTAMSQVQVPAILDAYEFGRFATLVDVGGGRGALLAAVLRAHPRLEGVLYDLPDVVAEADPLAADDVAPRARVRGGDFFASVPEGGDGYLLKLVVHDWDDERAGRILANVRAVIPDDGRLLVVEHVLPADDAFHYSLFLDLNMLVLLGAGRERTRDEYDALFRRAGFALTRVIPTASPLSLLEGTPAEP